MNKPKEIINGINTHSEAKTPADEPFKYDLKALINKNPTSGKTGISQANWSIFWKTEAKSKTYIAISKAIDGYNSFVSDFVFSFPWFSKISLRWSAFDCDVSIENPALP